MNSKNSAKTINSEFQKFAEKKKSKNSQELNLIVFELPGELLDMLGRTYENG